MSDSKVVLAYSGDLRSSLVLAWLLEHGVADVATVTLDLGQGRDLNDVRDRALGIGASRAHVIDVRDEFAREAVAPAWRLPMTEPRVAALGRPFIARQLVEIAGIEGASGIAHGSAFPATDPQGLEAAVRATGTEIPVLAPAREWGMDESQLIDYARARGIPVSANAEDAIEVRNLWGRVAQSRFVMTASEAQWPSEPALIDITFDQYRPVALNGVSMPLVDLIVSLDTLAGEQGVGRLPYPDAGVTEEAPASFVIHEALQALGAGAGTIRATCRQGTLALSASTR